MSLKMKNKLADVVRDTWMKDDSVLIAAVLDPCVKQTGIAPPKVADLKLKFLRSASVYAKAEGSTVCRTVVEKSSQKQRLFHFRVGKPQ